jgi:hypothetical protein
MNLTFESEQEDDGRWIAEVPELHGCMAYCATQQQAIIKAEAFNLRVLADRLKITPTTLANISTIIVAECMVVHAAFFLFIAESLISLNLAIIVVKSLDIKVLQVYFSSFTRT